MIENVEAISYIPAHHRCLHHHHWWSQLQSKQAALRKFLMKLLTIKKLHTLSPGPVFGVRTWLRDEHFTDDGRQYIIEISEMNTLRSPQDSSDQRLGVIIRLKQSDRADIFTRDVKLIITRPDTCYGVFNYQIESAKLALTVLLTCLVFKMSQALNCLRQWRPDHKFVGNSPWTFLCMRVDLCNTIRNVLIFPQVKNQRNSSNILLDHWVSNVRK